MKKYKMMQPNKIALQFLPVETYVENMEKQIFLAANNWMPIKYKKKTGRNKLQIVSAHLCPNSFQFKHRNPFNWWASRSCMT